MESILSNNNSYSIDSGYFYYALNNEIHSSIVFQ